jgi:hypothetical protein
MASKNTTVILGITGLALIIVFILGASAYTKFRAKKEGDLDFREWVELRTETLSWKNRTPDKALTRQNLLDSMAAGRSFLLANQRDEGNFNYEYDWLNKKQSKQDNQVRQAGALWGISLLHRHQPSDETAAALDRGLAFFFANSVSEPTGAYAISYKRERYTKTGTVALVALAIIEYLRAEPEMPSEQKEHLDKYLKGYLQHLKNMRLENGGFSDSYSIKNKRKTNRNSPYFDGESLLAFSKAARYLGYTDLVPLIEDSAIKLAKRYTREAWKKDRDSDKTKGFFQWGSMCFWEYYEASWKDAEMFGDIALMLSHWMIHVHNTLRRTRNTAYAYEGIVSAYDIAQKRGDKNAIEDLGYVIDRGLYKLTSWQVGGPLADKNKYLVSNPTDDAEAIGGIMNMKNDAPLRIDVTQHQMHAVILALNLYFGE